MFQPQLRDEYQGRHVLITGGLGFIGSNLAEALVGLGARVTILDSMIPAYGGTLEHIESIQNSVSINFSDMRDPHSMRYLVANQEIIFNLAGQVSHVDSMRDPLNDLDINCRSQLSLLECVRSVNPEARIVFTSTRQVYGRPRKLPVSESHPLNPADVNGVNKLAAEMYFQLYARVYGMHCVSLRLTNTYGPRMDLRNATKGFVGVFLQRALTGQPITVFGDGTQRRDFNHVKDVVHALLLVGVQSDLDGEVFNLGGDSHYSLRQFLSVLQQFADFEIRFAPFPYERREIDIGDYWGDYERLHHRTGWQPTIDLFTGIADTLDYFRNHPNLVPGLQNFSIENR